MKWPATSDSAAAAVTWFYERCAFTPMAAGILPTPIYVDADLTRLAQVFSNLLANSVNYTPPGGQIWLIAEGFDNEVTIQVRDKGLGIPAESLPRIFQIFSQVDRNMEGAQGGLDIGLSLVWRLVEMHVGTVEAHSDGPGQGSEFTVRMPALKLTQPTATSLGEVHPGATARRRILVVDDNHDSAISLEMLLKLMGNDTQTAHDGLAAVEAAEQFQPDMILLDIGRLPSNPGATLVPRHGVHRPDGMGTRRRSPPLEGGRV